MTNQPPEDHDPDWTAWLQAQTLDDLPDNGFSAAVMRALPTQPVAGRRSAVLRWAAGVWPAALGVATAGFVAWSPALLAAARGSQPLDQALPGLALLALVGLGSWWWSVGEFG